MKIIALLPLLASASLGLAQTKSDVQLPSDVRMYEPKNLTPDKAMRVAISVHNLIGNVGLSWDEVMHAFVIRSTNSAAVDMAEALLKKYDVPDPRVEVTVYLVRAATAPPPPTDPRVTTLPPNPVPAELKAAIDEMKGALNYDRFTLWDVIVLQPKGNGGELQGILPSDPGSRSYIYTVTYGIYPGGPITEGKTLNLANFTFSVKMPQGKEDVESHIRTDVTVREGQKLVLGKIRLLPGANADLFLVLATKVY